MKVNACKSFFCAVETEYLGYVLSRDGIRPQQKKEQANRALIPSQNVKQLHRFLGMVQYYRDIWARRSQLLASLADLVGVCGHTKMPQGPIKQKSAVALRCCSSNIFDNIKATIACDVTLAYPDYSQGFEVYIDSSKLQLGAVITQNNMQLAFFSRKLSPMQQKYSMIEQEHCKPKTPLHFPYTRV